MTPEAAWVAPLGRLGLALAIGFLVGIERGWKQREEPEGSRAAGVRTFALSGLLGGLAGLSLPVVGPVPVAAILLVSGTAFAVFEYRRATVEGDNSATTTVAGLIVLALGVYAAVGSQTVAAAGGVATVAILAFKQGLHEWLRSLTWKEIRSAVLILAATFIALPVLPKGPIDPWGVFEPRPLWILTILIAGASFAGYVALRALGARAGLIAGSLAGALVSSTAVTLDLARRVQAKETSERKAAIAAVLATGVSIVRVGVLSAIVAIDVAARLAPSLLAAGVLCTLGAVALYRLDTVDSDHASQADLKSPLDLLAVGRTAAVLCGLTVLANIASRVLGANGLVAFAAAAGLADVDATTVAVGRLVRSGLAVGIAGDLILVAILADQVLKVVAALIIGTPRFALRFAIVTVIAIAGGAATRLLLSVFG